MKHCPKCGKDKDESEFHKCRAYKDGLYYICKECAMVAKLRYKYSERGKQKDKEYSLSQKGREAQKRQRIKRQITGAESKRDKNRRKDPNYRISLLYANRLYKAIAQPPKHPEKSIAHQELLRVLGCSIEEFKRHLESQFTEGMSWDNYGGVDGWAIDHIVPRSYFDVTNDDELRICFNWRNCQPLWRSENSGVKNASLPENYQEIINNIKKELGL